VKLDITIKETKDQPTLTIRESTTLESIPYKMGKLFSEILAFMGKKGITPAGAPSLTGIT
jgi:hypothetical protein